MSTTNSRSRKVDSRNKKALTLDIDTIREWLVNSCALIRWTADENMIMNGLTKNHKESRQHLVQVLQNSEWSLQRDATLLWHGALRTDLFFFKKTREHVGLGFSKFNYVSTSSQRIAETMEFFMLIKIWGVFLIFQPSLWFDASSHAILDLTLFTPSLRCEGV